MNMSIEMYYFLEESRRARPHTRTSRSFTLVRYRVKYTINSRIIVHFPRYLIRSNTGVEQVSRFTSDVESHYYFESNNVVHSTFVDLEELSFFLFSLTRRKAPFVMAITSAEEGNAFAKCMYVCNYLHVLSPILCRTYQASCGLVRAAAVVVCKKRTSVR